MAIERPALARPAAKEKPRLRADFLLCNSCLWCASCLGSACMERCPACSAPVEALPIQPNEAYTMKKMNGGSGVELDFTLVA